MSKGFLWFAQNNGTTDYARLSVELARSIKQHNKINTVCVVTDTKTKINSEFIDTVVVMQEDNSSEDTIKFGNEHKAFALSPFTHTIKLEADMLWTANTDWWWNYLSQHDLVFSVNCLNYRDEVIAQSLYRKLFALNHLPDVYNGLMYFRRSQTAKQFYTICKQIMENWKMVRDNLLKSCHDDYPTTDVVYGLAYRIMDPTNEGLINYDWFKFIHSKPSINGVNFASDLLNYLYPIKLDDRVYLGGRRLNRVWHYYDKKTMEDLNARVF